MAQHVKCVILNACYSEIQANAIADHIPYVIGMSQAIGDKAAIAFSTGFYKALGAGCTFKEAYRFGCLEIQLENIAEHLTPILHRKKESIDDLYYVKRPPIEKICFESIQHPSCLIRIKGCHQMGKTFLMQKILSYAENRGYKTILLNLQLVEQKVVSNLDSFLRWFCIISTRRLNLPNRLDEYWDVDLLSSSMCCTNYFEEYLLNHINEPIVLGIDELGWLSETPTVIEDFLGMLRAWHEQSKYQKSWRKLRIIMTYHKELYTERSTKTSPFNQGIPISLSEFTLEQVKDLIQRYGFNWTTEEIEQLMALVGGYPWLIQHALEQMQYQDVTLNQILDTAIKETGIYSHHLQQKLLDLQHHPSLLSAFSLVINSLKIPQGEINALTLNDLAGLGLVKVEDQFVKPSCELYTQYFLNRLNLS
jgi:hypothetical protein